MTLLAALLAGCGDATREMPLQPASDPAPAPGLAEPATAPASSPPVPPPRGSNRLTRTIDQDPDGDGIANRRIVITESFDDAGTLLERVREVDFEADGIIDARNVTTFAD